MAAWYGDHDEPYTADDATLLRAIDLLEERLPSEAMGQPVEGAIRELIVEHQRFAIIRSNDHLRGLLRAYLEANIAVELKTKELFRESNKGFITKLFTQSRLDDLQHELAALKVIRDEAFKPYEMLRKLSDNENVLLKRYPS